MTRHFFSLAGFFNIRKFQLVTDELNHVNVNLLFQNRAVALTQFND